MGRFIGVLYSVVVYGFFLASFLYAVGFVTGFYVPKTIDSGPTGSLSTAIIVDLALLGIFAVTHSGMARPAFKRWWTRIVPPSAERSTYVLVASLTLSLLCWQWRPIPEIVWQVSQPMWATTIIVIGFAGWLLVLLSTFLLNHFELFGLQQAFSPASAHTPTFKTPSLYRLVRHPIYLGFVIAFWAAPVMTVGHLLFAAATTAYILIGIHLEERDLVELFGNDYRNYRSRVGMLCPAFRKPAGSSTEPAKTA
jgi:protein-S-isoprenylcysteine O-methyltransferase Ste14